jgi:transposase
MDKVNKYCHRSHISERNFRQIIRYFAMDLEATKIAELTGVSRNSVNRILKALRKRMAEYCESQSPFSGEIEVDEAYFGARRVRGKRGRGAGGKIPVFGLLKRQGKVYTQIVSDCPRKTLQSIIKGKVDFNSIIHSDSFRSYDSLVDLGYKRHYRVNHGKDEFANKKSHINGIENFWGIAKMRLSKFRGLNKNTFYLHLKETEFRFNHRNEDVYKMLLQMLKYYPLKLS